MPLKVYKNQNNCKAIRLTIHKSMNAKLSATFGNGFSLSGVKIAKLVSLSLYEIIAFRSF